MLPEGPRFWHIVISRVTPKEYGIGLEKVKFPGLFRFIVTISLFCLCDSWLLRDSHCKSSQLGSQYDRKVVRM